jgi:hypothetical protein
MTRPLLILGLALAASATTPLRCVSQGRSPVRLPVGRTLDDLKNGARLRVSLQDEGRSRLEGTLQGFGRTSLLLNVGGKQQEFSFNSILAVDEAYHDRKRAAIVGMVAAVVGVYAWDFFGSHPKYADQKKRYVENLEALAIGVPVGAGIGWAIGWGRWRPVSTLPS